MSLGLSVPKVPVSTVHSGQGSSPAGGREGQGYRTGLGWVASLKRSQAEQRKLWQVWRGGPSWLLAVTTGTRKGEAGTDGQPALH